MSFRTWRAHDLQEPLRKIINFSDMLTKDIGEELNEDAAYDLDLICKAAHRMRKI